VPQLQVLEVLIFAVEVNQCLIRACISMVDELDDSAQAINSVNIILNDNGYLKPNNTDYFAIIKLLAQYDESKDLVFAVKVWPKQSSLHLKMQGLVKVILLLKI
jgi:hypothetical protein